MHRCTGRGAVVGLRRCGTQCTGDEGTSHNGTPSSGSSWSGSSVSAGPVRPSAAESTRASKAPGASRSAGSNAASSAADSSPSRIVCNVAVRGPPGHERIGVDRERDRDRDLPGRVAVCEGVTARREGGEAAGHAGALQVMPVADELVRRVTALAGDGTGELPGQETGSDIPQMIQGAVSASSPAWRRLDSLIRSELHRAGFSAQITAAQQAECETGDNKAGADSDSVAQY
jgi:hypothetical protein